MEEALLFTKLDQKGIAITLKEEHLLPWTKALQRRMDRTDELGAVTNAKQGGTKTPNFCSGRGTVGTFWAKLYRPAPGTRRVSCLKQFQILSQPNTGRSCIDGF